MTIPRCKRVPINWKELKKCIYEQGYNYNSLAKKVGVSYHTFSQTDVDGKMNPLIVLEIGKYINIDVASILKDIQIERIYNGRSTSGRIGTDWLYLKRECKRKGSSLYSLSLELDRSAGYLSSCKREGGISEDVMIQIGEILDIDYHNLIKVTSYEKWNLRYEIVDMVNDHKLPDFSKGMKKEINDIYQGSSPYWCRLKEVMTGEVSNYIIRDSDIIRKSDYDLAEKYRPNLQSFSVHDVVKCTNINDLPTDWKHLAYACMKKYGLPPFSEETD